MTSAYLFHLVSTLLTLKLNYAIRDTCKGSLSSSCASVSQIFARLKDRTGKSFSIDRPAIAEKNWTEFLGNLFTR